MPDSGLESLGWLWYFYLFAAAVCLASALRKGAGARDVLLFIAMLVLLAVHDYNTDLALWPFMHGGP
jgi:hypothetical protein